MHKEITSSQNPGIRKLLQLQERSRTRKKERLFIIEGQREIGLALRGGYVLREIYYVPEMRSPEEMDRLFPDTQAQMIQVSTEVYGKLAYRGSTEGILAVAEAKDLSLDQVQLSENPLILIAEAPEKPGNIGAILRTADAAAVDAVLIANPRTDMFNPNIIRSSVGCVFTNQVSTGSTSEIISFLEERQIAIFCAALQASAPYDSVDYTSPSAIVVGTEAIGLSEQWLERSYQNIVIPMQGSIDSMNVSVAAGILVFEARRQRRSLQKP